VNKLVFVSTPYAKLEPQQAKRIAVRACKEVKAQNLIPISPVLAFEGVYNEATERSIIEAICADLLVSCDYFHYYKCSYSEDSLGMQKELALAKQYGKIFV